MNMQCEENDDIVDLDCDFAVAIDKEKYDGLETASFKIISAEIIDDCLVIKIGASGCSTDNWSFNLVDSGAIAESSPEQRYLKFQLINNEVCLAYFEKTISFNLKPLQIDNSVNEVILHIEGLESSLNYTY
ncbi:hypothetical protein [Hwangdonia seohaensis]|uniref:Uncharacterized protein n=1 Tax=Hwangdonia seohaensis TaxID=1240727 RepID=A0ABW3RD33_9FLAO|nr:hypothetical protein [Hwangdonia seohaensis]